MITIAIDPGKSGGIAVAYGTRIIAYSMPETNKDICDILESARDHAKVEGVQIVAAIEKVNGFMGKAAPGSRMFTFGEQYGVIQGLLMALKIPLRFVGPKDWQAPLHLGKANQCTSKSEWKNKLKAEAQNRHPDLKISLNTADAVLILDYINTTLHTYI